MNVERHHAYAVATAGALLAFTLGPSQALVPSMGGWVPAAYAATADNGLPQVAKYVKVSDATVRAGTYSFVSTSSNDGKLRIMHRTDGQAKLDRCTAKNTGEVLAPVDCEVGGLSGKHTHEWGIESVDGGFAIQSKTGDGRYVHIESGKAEAAAGAQTLQIQRMDDGAFSIGRQVGGAMKYLAYTAGGWSVSDTPYGISLYRQTMVTPQVVPNGKGDTGTTEGQPFAKGTGGSQNYRIPALTTLADGTLFAAIDARWNTQADAGGLDTIISTSKDNGKTWSYSFPNYFNDSTDAYNNKATAFIDPVVVQDDAGAIHMMVDLWPGGVALNSAFKNNPVNGSGYVQIEGKQRLVLYASADADEQRAAGAERGEGYTHYVGDFAADGKAPVIKVSDNTVEYYVDREFFLFNKDGEPIYCPQIGSSDYVQQNVFYFNATLHVMATSYLWHIASTDGGATWSAPDMLNEQVRAGRSSNDCFYGVGPGRGLVTSTGRIILPCYTYKRGHGDGNSSVIYSDDNGRTWKRSNDIARQTSEATVVEADGRLYLFARHGWYAVSDDDGATWKDEKTLASSGLNITTTCQIDALAYSQKIDGKTAIILSAPTGGSRANGKVFVGLVEKDGSLTWKYNLPVTENGSHFAYSCLTEKQDGSLGLLYEAANADIIYRDLAIEDVAPGALIGDKRLVTVPLYGTFSHTVEGAFTGYGDIDRSVVDIRVIDNGDGTKTVTYTGKAEGEVRFTEESSGAAYTVRVAPRHLVERAIDPGQTISEALFGGGITHEPDTAVATAKLASSPLIDVIGEVPGSLGTDASFTGEAIALSRALFTFTANGNGWTVAGTDSNGKAVHVNLDSAGFPGNAAPKKIELRAGEKEGTVKLYDAAASRYLHFHRNGTAVFDRCTNDTSGADCYELYRKAEGASSDIAGYERLSGKDAVKNGDKLLIVARVDGAGGAADTLYALNPSLSTSNKYAHVVKVDSERTSTTLSITGVAPGVTDIAVGDTVYRVTVRGLMAPTFSWSDDYSHATATFERAEGDDAVEMDCTVTSERVEPTASKPGRVTYTATVERDGRTYTDVRIVELPAIGGPDLDPLPDPAPGQPGTLPEPEQPEAPGQGADGPDGRPGTNGSSALPATGDAAAAAGVFGALGAALAAWGVRRKRR